MKLLSLMLVWCTLACTDYQAQGIAYTAAAMTYYAPYVAPTPVYPQQCFTYPMGYGTVTRCY